MGLIMVVGIVAKNGILLLDAEQKFGAAGLSLEDTVIQAGRRRFSPIVITALAGVAGMLPLALSLGAGSQNAEAAGDCGDRRSADLDGAIADHHSGGAPVRGSASAAKFDRVDQVLLMEQ
jgi:AcrB/AcrD/AcrF family